MNKLRVLVCGGRNFDDNDFIYLTLDTLMRERGEFEVVIHGCCRGADKGAERWAIENHIKMAGFRAEWEKYGKAAGPKRNARMLADGRPDFVVAFPGDKGTADMVHQARAAGVEVIEVEYPIARAAARALQRASESEGLN